MPSKNMIPKGKRRRSVKAEYRVVRTAATEAEEVRKKAVFDAAALVYDDIADDVEEVEEDEVATPVVAEPVAAEPVVVPEMLVAEAADADRRLDTVLAQRIVGISRARVQLWIERGAVLVEGEPVRASHKLREGDQIRISGNLAPAPLKAEPEDIPLDIIYEDADLAVINKPAAMMVHAGNGATDEARHRGTLVNALLHHFKALSEVGGEMRPGIVHRLDKETSGLILVAKNDVTHRKLSEMFAAREVRKSYIALVHGDVKLNTGTINSPITRDTVRRTRMKALTRNYENRLARNAISHYRVIERIDSPWGKFTLVEVRIETGRTHQIRVHMSSIGHPVVGDALYGAPREILPVGLQQQKKSQVAKKIDVDSIHLGRNFLHAARLGFVHPTSGKEMKLEALLPPGLTKFLDRLRAK